MTVAAREDVGLAATGNDIGQRPVVARMPDRRDEPISQLAPGITRGTVRHAHGPAIVDRGLMVRIIRRITHCGGVSADMAAAVGNATEMMDARKAVAIFMNAPRCRRASARRERSIALFVRSIESGPFAGNPLSRSLLGVKRTWLGALHMSAFDPKRAGSGPPLVKTANWLNHLEYDWESPVWSHLLHALAAEHRLIRYDERGNGLSDWNVNDISFEAFVRDLETVVDAARLDRFSLLGVSQGCPVSIVYALRNPGRVSHLVLYGGYARGWRRRGDPAEIEKADAVQTLMRHGWGQENPAFRQIFTTRFMPSGTSEQMRWFNDLQRMTTSPDNAARIRRANENIDITDLLPQVRIPTLVLHCRNDAAQPHEEGRILAAGIPGARFVTLEGHNHLILESDPCWARFLDEIMVFLKT